MTVIGDGHGVLVPAGVLFAWSEWSWSIDDPNCGNKTSPYISDGQVLRLKAATHSFTCTDALLVGVGGLFDDII